LNNKNKKNKKIKKTLSNHKAHRVLLDYDNVVNHLSIAVKEKIGKQPSKLVVLRTLLVKIEGGSLKVEGVLYLPITINGHL